MNRKKTGRILGVLSLAVFLTGCAPDARASAEDLLAGVVSTSVETMGEVAATAPSDVNPTATHYMMVATHELLSGLETLPEGGATDTMYCLEQVGDKITACVFFPMNVSIPSGLSSFASSIYGCAELSSVAGSRAVEVEDAECPSELVAWFAERSDEDPSVVSIEALAPGSDS